MRAGPTTLQPPRPADAVAALDALGALGEASDNGDAFAHHGVRILPRLVSSELTTLSVCDLDGGHRAVVSDLPGAIPRRELEAFDRYFYEHPLVREHGRNPRPVTRRINDLVPAGEFARTPLYGEYYRAIGIDHAMAVPIHVDGKLLVSFVFNRSRRGFSDRDRARLELLRPPLGQLYRLLSALDQARAAPAGSGALSSSARRMLSARECDVLQWLAGGKTDRDIAEILGLSPRTVHKHLQRIYQKLGVETRTAAVMRALTLPH